MLPICREATWHPGRIRMTFVAGRRLADLVNCNDVYVIQFRVSILWGSNFWRFNRNEI